MTNKGTGLRTNKAKYLKLENYTENQRNRKTKKNFNGILHEDLWVI